MKLVHCRNDAAIPTMDYKYYNNNNNGNGNNNYNYQYEYNKHAYSPLEGKREAVLHIFCREVGEMSFYGSFTF